MEETVEIVDPVVEVVFLIFLIAEVTWLQQPSRQSVGSMDLTRDVAELEMEGENGDYPAVNTGRGRNVRVV